jgi:hypothetical protein
MASPRAHVLWPGRTAPISGYIGSLTCRLAPSAPHNPQMGLAYNLYKKGTRGSHSPRRVPESSGL